MNSANRLINILTSINENDSYFIACVGLFGIDNRYEQLYFYKYFMQDIKNIERILKNTNKYKENIHDEKLGLVALCISPNYLQDFSNYSRHEVTQKMQIEKSDKKNNILFAIDFLELMETFLDDEVLYNEDIEALRIALKDLKKTNSPLDDVIKDIDEAVLYYGYFGNNIIEDKFHKVLGTTLINIDTLKPLVKKFPKAFKIIISFFDVYKKIKQVKEDFPVLIEDIKSQLGCDSENESLDISIIDEE